jgi:sugar/nucleoside kinase (ribokinase family)
MVNILLTGVIVADTIYDGRAPIVDNDEIKLMNGCRDTLGGYGNVVRQAVTLFDEVACGGLVNGSDMRGRVIKDTLAEIGANTDGLKDTQDVLNPHQDYSVLGEDGKVVAFKGSEVPTSASVILFSGSKRGIGHLTGANSLYSPQHVGKELDGVDTAVVLYAGLLYGWDGQPMVDFCRKCRERGILTVSAANGAENADEATLKKIRADVSELDVFICNRQEAEAIAGKKGQSLSAKHLVAEVSEVMGVRECGRSRLLAVTDGKNDANLLYCRPDGTTVEVAVPQIEVKPKHPTGAGDNFLLGLVKYVSDNRAAFNGGTLDVAMAGKYGNAMGTLHIAGDMGRIKMPSDLDDYVKTAFPQRLSVDTLEPPAAARRRDTV